MGRSHLEHALEVLQGAFYRLGLLTLKGNRNGIISILVGHVHGGRRIIGG